MPFVDLTEPNLTSTGDRALTGAAAGEGSRNCEGGSLSFDIDCNGQVIVVVVHDLT